MQANQHTVMPAQTGAGSQSRRQHVIWTFCLGVGCWCITCSKTRLLDLYEWLRGWPAGYILLAAHTAHSRCQYGVEKDGACLVPATLPGAGYPPIPSERPPFYLGTATSAPQVLLCTVLAATHQQLRQCSSCGLRCRLRAPSAKRAGLRPYGTSGLPLLGTPTTTRHVRLLTILRHAFVFDAESLHGAELCTERLLGQGLLGKDISKHSEQ